MPVVVPLRPDEDPELVADVLFAAGASAVAEAEHDGGPALVADLAPTAVRELGRPDLVVAGPAPGDPPARPPAPPIRAGRGIVVVDERWIDEAADDEPTDEGRTVVRIARGRAFGGGTHPSTRLCLAALEPLAPSARDVLDVGSGTGVLGVCAAVLGAGRVRCIDVDPEAVLVSAATARLNGVEDRVRADDGPLHRVRGAFDLVLANLLVPVVEELGAELAARVRPGGHLVVGGLLLEHRRRAVRALAPLSVELAHVEGDWAALVLAAPPEDTEGGRWATTSGPAAERERDRHV